MDDMQLYMLEMIREKRMEGLRVERYDLFSSLMDASDQEDSSMTDEELIGMSSSVAFL